MSSTIRRHPLGYYFLVTFAISWGLASIVVLPYITQGRPIPYFTGILMFPLMILGPPVAGTLLTRVVDGPPGLRELVSQLRNWRIGKRFLVVFIPPLSILAILTILSSFVSSVFLPNFFVFGFGFGILAGFLEEIGWTGYATRKLLANHGGLASATILGLIWGLWHAPVVDFLGAAYPHGSYWVPFFLSFVGIQSAIRVLIFWLYRNSRSILAAQVLHMSSTGSLATLAPLAVSAQQETGWYALDALLLWVIISLLVMRFERNLARFPD